MTRETIVRAAARLLADEGAAAVTTRGVAQAAGVQAPTLYRLFGDKDGLLDAVAEHVMATYVATKAADADLDPLAALGRGWTHHVEFGLAHPTLFAVLADPRRAASPAAARGHAVLRARVHRVAAAGLLRVAEQRAVALIHAAGTGVILTLLATPPADRIDDLADTAWDAVGRAILADRPAPATDDTTADAVRFRTLVPQLPGLSPAERALMGEWLDRSLAAR